MGSEPHNPRTLFLNDSVVIGWVRKGFIEIAAQDSQRGVINQPCLNAGLGKNSHLRLDRDMESVERRAQVAPLFYTLARAPVEKPQFTRRDECLQCHNSNNAMGVPGMLVRSQFTASNGEAMRWLGCDGSVVRYGHLYPWIARRPTRYQSN